MSPVNVECVAVGSSEAYIDAGISLEVFVLFLLSVSSCESLNSVRTYVRLVCEWGHRAPAFHGLSGVSTRFALKDQIKFGNRFQNCRNPF